MYLFQINQFQIIQFHITDKKSKSYPTLINEPAKDSQSSFNFLSLHQTPKYCKYSLALLHLNQTPPFQRKYQLSPLNILQKTGDFLVYLKSIINEFIITFKNEITLKYFHVMSASQSRSFMRIEISKQDSNLGPPCFQLEHSSNQATQPSI